MMAPSRFRVNALQLIAAIALLPLGFVVISWYAAESPHDNPSIPAAWPAGVPAHGEFYRWPLGTIHDSPILFASCAALLFACVLFLIISGMRAAPRAAST
jgi:hypothetical protein